MAVVALADPDLFTETLEWTRQWWDPDVALLWNPDGAFPELAAGRTLHQVPNTAWYAWALLATGDPADEADARRCLESLLALQHDAPGTAYEGTFRRFLEWPETPPANPVMWEDYDPNWRQFVGTAFALVLEDFGDRLGDDLGGRLLMSCRRAAMGEPDGRIPTSYTNPALMRAWLDAWVGSRTGDPPLLARGEGFAARIVERFDRIGTFDEFNSPTYYGIDLYALSLWRTFGPTPQFRDQGRRLELAVWTEMLDLYSPDLRNWAGPYTRSYHPDATRSVAKAALWMWAESGRSEAPLPQLTADAHHGHDLASGPVISRLHQPVAAGLAGAARRAVPRVVAVTIGDREVRAQIGRDLMIGAESSSHDWGGWEQFMPFVAHWRAGDSVETLWLARPHQLSVKLTETTADLAVGGTESIDLWLRADRCEVRGDILDTGTRRIAFAIGPRARSVSGKRHPERGSQTVNAEGLSVERAADGVADRWLVRVAATRCSLDFDC